MNKKDNNYICTFTLKEKIFAQFSFHAGVLTGAYGIFLSNKILGIAYLLYSYIGIVLLMRYTVCPRCPHLHVANDCLQLHPSITKIIVSPNRKGALNIIEKILFFMVLYGILLLPIYWIASNTIILVLFLLFYGGLLLTMHLHFCPNCQNESCVQNRNENLIKMPKIG
jgi:hypothetical protein